MDRLCYSLLHDLLVEKEMTEPIVEEGSDPEAGMQAPDKRAGRDQGRGQLMFLLFVIFCFVVCYLLSDELTYFFADSTPTDLGRAEEVTSTTLSHGAFVQIEGIARDMCVRAELRGHCAKASRRGP